MNIYKSGLFPYISGDSLVGKAVTMTMARVTEEAIQVQGGKAEKKLVLYFKETSKGLVLNKTNAKRIAKLFGGETEAWAGQVIELYTEEVQAFGDTHNAVRVRESQAAKTVARAKERSAKKTVDERHQDIEQSPLQPPDDNGSEIGGDIEPLSLFETDDQPHNGGAAYNE